MSASPSLPGARPDKHHSPDEGEGRRAASSWAGAAGAGLVVAACSTATPSSLTAPLQPTIKNGDHGPATGGSVATVDGPSIGMALSSDTDILKFALFLELLEAEFYKAAVASTVLSGLVRAISTDVRDHEICHVALLRAALGAQATGNRITFDFSQTLRNERQFLNAAESLEHTGVGAYLGALPLIRDHDLRRVADTIFTIEARHTVAFRALNHRMPAQIAFETPLTPQQVISALAPFVVEGL